MLERPIRCLRCGQVIVDYDKLPKVNEEIIMFQAKEIDSLKNAIRDVAGMLHSQNGDKCPYDSLSGQQHDELCKTICCGRYYDNECRTTKEKQIACWVEWLNGGRKNA